MRTVLAVLVISLVPVLAIVRGFVLCTLWGWFIVPVFGAPALTIPASIGLMYVGALVSNENTAISDKAQSEHIVAYILNPLVLLLCGWVVHLFM